MFQSLLQHTDNGTTVSSVRLVYLSGLATETDSDVLRQLASLPGHPHVVAVASVPDAIAELRKTIEDYQALVMSPALSQSETAEAIAAVRQEEPVVTILPVVYDYNQHDFVSVGANDVLILADGLFVDPVEIVARVAPISEPAEFESTDDQHVDGPSGQRKKKAGSRLRGFLSSVRDRMREQGDDQVEAFEKQEETHREIVQNRLHKIAKDVHGESTPDEGSARSEVEATTETQETEHTPFVELKLSPERPRVVDRAPTPTHLSIVNPPAVAPKAVSDPALAGAQAALQQASETIVAERAAWSRIRQELEEATAAAQAEVRKAVSLHAVDVEAHSKAIRAATDTQATLEAALAEAEASRQKATEELVAGRAEWDAAREVLERSAATAKEHFDSVTNEHAAALETQTRALQEARETSAKLEKAVADAQAEQRSLAATISAERVAWNADRQELEDSLQVARSEARTAAQSTAELEVRTKELQTASEARAKLDAALAQAQGESQKTSEALTAERATWAGERQELEARARTAQEDVKRATSTYAAELDARSKALDEATEARAKVEATLAETKGEQRRANDAFIAERAAWNAMRQHLEAAVHDARSKAKSAEQTTSELNHRMKELRESIEARAKLEAALAEAHAGRHRADQAFEAERTTWQVTQEELETALQNSRTKLETAERKAADLDARTEELRNVTEARVKVEASLAKVHAEREQAEGAFTAERASWEAARRQLEAEAQESHAKLQAAEQTAQVLVVRTKELQEAIDVRTRLEAELAKSAAEHQTTRNAFDAERAGWQTARHELETALGAADAKLLTATQTARELEARTQALREATQARTRLEADLSHAKAVLQQLQETSEAERTASSDARQKFEDILQETRAQLTTAQQSAGELEIRTSELRAATEARAKTDAELAAVRAEHQKALGTYDADRRAWTAARQELDGTLQDARTKLTGAAAELEARVQDVRLLNDARAKHEAALVEANAERERAKQAFEAERAVWTTTRQGLESAASAAQGELNKAVGRHTAEHALLTKELHETAHQRTALEAMLRRAETEFGATEARHAAEVKAWEKARKSLEQLVGAQSAAVREELQGEIANARAELTRRTETFNAERTDWQLSRRLLERKVTDLQAAADARDNLEEALMAARTELQEAIDAHAAERTTWEELRQKRDAARDAKAGATGDRKKGGSAAPEKEDEVLDAYRALEARVRETTNRLNLVRGGSGKWLLGADGGYDTREGLAHSERLHSKRVEEVAKLAIAMTPGIAELVASIEEFGSQLAQEEGPTEGEPSNARTIVERSKEAGEMLRQLSAFIEKQTQPVVAINLADAIREAEPVLTWVVGTHVDFKTQLNTTGVVNVPRDDFQRMLTAVVMAARDLLTAGGSVVVEVSAQEADDRQPLASGAPKEGGSILIVTASGYGVRPPSLSPELDLLIRECGGSASVASTTGEGSSFEIVFAPPRQLTAVESPRRQDPPAPALRTAG